MVATPPGLWIYSVFLLYLSLIDVSVVCETGDSMVQVTTDFQLYGPEVEPWTDGKQTAVKAAIVQAAGHGVTAEQVAISVLGTYSNQQQSGRRLRASTKLNGPGVTLQAVTKTTRQNADVVAQAIIAAIHNGNIVNVYQTRGNQRASYASVVPNSTGTSGSNGSIVSKGGNTSNGGKKGFPAWAGALIAVLVLVLAIIAAYFVWRKCAAQRYLEQDGMRGGAFPNTTPNGKASLVKLQPSSGNPHADDFAAQHGSSQLDAFRGPMGVSDGGGSGGVGRVRPPSRPSWALASAHQLEDCIDEDRPLDNPMLGFSSTSSSLPAGATTARNEAYTPYAPSRTGRLMSYMRGT